MELGIDSFGAIELRNTLEERFAVSLPATLAFDYPTTSTMVTFIFELLHTVPIQRRQQKHMGERAQDQTMIMTEERLLDIVRSILGTDISVDQVPNFLPSLSQNMFI